MEATLPTDAAQGWYTLGEIYRSRAVIAEAQPLAGAQLLEASVRCFEAVLGMPPVDPPIDLDALMELASALLELGRVCQLAQGPGSARVPELVMGAAARCAAVEALDPAQTEFAMDLKMDIARVVMGHGDQVAAAAAWSTAFAACEAAAAGAEGQQGADEIRARALYNAACVAALRTPLDEMQARACLTSAVEMALAADAAAASTAAQDQRRAMLAAPTQAAVAAASGGQEELDDAYVTLDDLQGDSDLACVRGCDWFGELVVRLGGSGGGSSGGGTTVDSDGMDMEMS